MSIPRLLIALAVLAFIGGSSALVARAQERPARGSEKVQSRTFNPFELRPSRITLNPFGLFSFMNSTPFAEPRSMTNPPTRSGDDTAPVAAASLAPPDEEDDEIVLSAVVRPPFRPPIRSPYRVPPRPPF